MAIEIPERLKGGVKEVQERLRGILPGVRWVAPEGVHLTLKFLGEIEAGQVEEVSQAISPVVKGVQSFSIVIKGVGTFPDIRRPRVIYLGMAKGGDGVRSLYEGIESALQGLGFEREGRAFHPHFTLGRFKGAGHLRDLPKILSPFSNLQLDPFTAHEVTFFKSELRPEGARYTRIAQFPLGG